MFQTIKKYALLFIELLIHICLVIFYFFRFLFKGRPELKDPAEKLCIDNKPHCCLHPTAGTANYNNGTTANGTAGARLSSYTDKMGRDSTTKTGTTGTTMATTVRSRMKRFWESTKRNLRWAYERLKCGCRGVKNRLACGCRRVKNGCAGLGSKLGGAFTWIASFFKRSTSKDKTDASSMSAVPWRRVSYSDSAPLPASTSSAHSSSIPAPPPPPPPSASNQLPWSNKSNSTKVSSWANNDNQPDSSKESAFMKSTSASSIPANWSSTTDRSTVQQPEIQFPVYPNYQSSQGQRSTPVVLPDSSRGFKSLESYGRSETAPTGSRYSSTSYFDHSATSAGADSEPLLMGRSVYTPVLEAEEMRPIINRRSSATPAPSDSRPASRASHTSRSYTRSRTVEPRSYKRATAAAEHQKYLSNAQFELSRLRDDTTTPVRAASRQWPPPSNATGPEIIKDLWMANVGPQMEPMELDPMTDPRALAQSWHAELMTTGGGGAPVIRNHFVSSSRGSYRESVFDQWMTSGETDDEGTINYRALRNPQGGVSDYHKLSKEYDVVMSNPERSVQLSAMLRGETGKGVDTFSRRREKTDKYAVEHQKASHRDVDPRDLAESVTDAAMRKSVEPTDWNRLSYLAFDRTLAKKLARRRGSVDRYTIESRRTPLREVDPRELVESVHEAAMRKSVEPTDWSRMSTATPTVFAGAAYDSLRSSTPFRPVSVAMNDVNSSDYHNRLFSPQPSDRPFSPSSENYNSVPEDWRSFRQKYRR